MHNPSPNCFFSDLNSPYGDKSGLFKCSARSSVLFFGVGHDGGDLWFGEDHTENEFPYGTGPQSLSD